MPWTKWRLLAKGSEWYDESLSYDGPACYELSIAGPRGGDRRVVYCGHTLNEQKRMSSYGRDGSHLADTIRWHLSKGWSLYYHSQSCESKVAAEDMERRLLARYSYDWNIHNNAH